MGENRHRHTVWMDDAVWDQVESHYQKDNCSTKNEYIEKAIQFYSGYLDAERADEYPCGIEILLVDGEGNVAALPRTTRIENTFTCLGGRKGEVA